MPANTMQATLLRVYQDLKALAQATIIIWQITVKNYNHTMSRKHQDVDRQQNGCLIVGLEELHPSVARGTVHCNII